MEETHPSQETNSKEFIKSGGDNEESSEKKQNVEKVLNGPLPLYKADVQGAIKLGESVMFTLEVKAVDSSHCRLIQRAYEDFEWLHHNLVSNNNIAGIIVPPLPTRSITDPKAAEKLSKKQLGDQTKVMKGDQFDVDCKNLGLYLEHMLKHPVFGVDKQLATFLNEDQAPVRARLNKGLMNRLSTVIDQARKGNVKDIDDKFAKEREFSLQFNRCSKEILDSFNKVLLSQWRLSSEYRTVASDLNTSTTESNDGLLEFKKILRIFSEGLEDEAASWELRSTREELGIGCYLDVMSRYSEMQKEMHFRRINAINELQYCEKVMEKAKPAKKAMAEEAFEIAKAFYEKTTQTACEEIQLFKQFRLKYSEEALTSHAETQMKISQDFYTQLFHTRKALLELKL